MELTKLKNKRTYLFGGIILFMIITIAGCEIPDALLDDQQPLGEWQVTEFTGSITDERTGGGIQNSCDYFLKTYNPVVSDGQTFIKFLNRKGEPDLHDIPHDVFDTLNIINEGGVFIFHFSFDNSYGNHSNEDLESYGVQYKYFNLIPDAWSFAIGVWTEDGVQGEIRLGISLGGISSFEIRGLFKSKTRIEGQWEWHEITAGIPDECATEALGSGRWVAIKK